MKQLLKVQIPEIRLRKVSFQKEETLDRLNALNSTTVLLFELARNAMNPGTLYIVGNGFDRYHGLDTIYQSFAHFLKKNYDEIYDLLIRYYGLPDLDDEDKYSDNELQWADFENSLARLDFQSVLEDKENYLASPSSSDFRDSDWHTYSIEMKMIVDTLTKDLCEAFRKFILAVEFPDSHDHKLLNIESNSIFLSFNYTDTIERYYGIKRHRILYIHGKAKVQGSKVILGHGVDPKAFEEKEEMPPSEQSAEEFDLWSERKSDNYDYSYESGKSQLMSYFTDSFKSANDMIQKHEAFFESLSEIKRIVVLGHSIAEVDQPYFRKVIQSIGHKASWTVTYYSECDLENHMKKLKSVGLEENQITLVKMESLRQSQPGLFD